ncbi:MAG: hypothetical protein WAU69_06380 [Solirubrobacteraceae bacterium]
MKGSGRFAKVLAGIGGGCVLGLALLGVQAPAAVAAKVDSEAVIARVNSATLEAQIDPEGHDTTCEAQYVEEAQFEHSGWTGVVGVPCSPEDLGSGSSDQATAVSLGGLRIATSYRYRFLATSQGSTVFGAEETFATFGIRQFSFEALDASEDPFTQAGGHPFELKAYISTNTTPDKGKIKISPDGIIKDLITELPAGLVGDPDAMPRCPGRVAEENLCGVASEIGTIDVYTPSKPNGLGLSPLFDVAPPKGDAARFAGQVNISADAYIDAGVRTGDGYGVTAGGYNLTELAGATAVSITLWGVPNDPSHNAERWCPVGGRNYEVNCEPEGPERPFLSMPTACDGAQSVTASLDSYQAPGEYTSKNVAMPAIVGCNKVPFAPEISASLTKGTADSPAGLKFDLHIPQNEEPSGNSSADLRDATVTLPKGMTVNPSSAAGLVGCPLLTGKEAHPGVSGIDTEDEEAANCPEASKIGTVEVDTPLLDHPLPGAVYLATPYQNPFGSLLAIYIAVSDPMSGVVVKLAGEVSIGAEGQLTATFKENPQLPFEDFKLDFFEGERAPLMTPATCGVFEATSSLTPWSAPESGPPATPEGKIEVTSSPSGGACPSSAAEEPNAPSLEAGSESTKAGAYTPFVLHLGREDGSQRISQVSISPPPGLVGKVAAIPYCPETDLAAAAAESGAQEQASPSCPANTELGTVSAGAGAGSEPFYVHGHAYFAGPYKGAPFSIAIITPALAGPFDLGDVVVRAGIYINPTTAQVTVKSDEIPSQLKGIPLDIRSINVNLSRSGFTINPTDCEALAVTGQTVSTLGQAANLSDRFQVGSCEKLTFKPSFKVTTHAAHTRRFGGYLQANVTSGAGQANIASVFVELPKILAARDETLNKACSEAQFAANPAACPVGSTVGTATAHTPLLAVPLTGPVIFVSHGGAKFPDLDAVLQGDGVTVVLKGATEINEKTEITSSDFKSVPDVPINSFQLTLPEGPYSALSATGNLCTHTATKRTKTTVHGHVVYRKRHVKQKLTLKMPTTITGHNGAVIKKTTIIAVEGCPKLKKPSRNH